MGRAIARVAALAAYLDIGLEFVVSSTLAHYSRSANFLVKNLAGDRMASLAEHLLVDRFAESEVEIASLFEGVRRLRTERNKIVHAVWGRSDEPESGRTVTIRPYRQPSEQLYSAPQIEAICDEIEKVNEDVDQWLERLELGRSEAFWHRPARPTRPTS